MLCVQLCGQFPLWLVLAQGLKWRVATVRVSLDLMERLAKGQRPKQDQPTIIKMLAPCRICDPVDRACMFTQLDGMLQATAFAVSELKAALSEANLAAFVDSFAQNHPGDKIEDFNDCLKPQDRSLDRA